MNKIFIVLILLTLSVKSQKVWTYIGPSQDSSNIVNLNKRASNIVSILQSNTGQFYALSYYWYGQNYRVLKYINNRWSPISNFYYGQNVQLVLDRNESPCLALQSSQNYQIFTYTGAMWTSLPTFTTTAFYGNSSNFFKLKFDKNNVPFVLYTNTTDSLKLTIKKFNSASWQTVGQTKFAASISNTSFYYVDQNADDYFDFTIDSASNIIVGSVLTTSLNTKLNIYIYNGTSWQLTNSLKSNSYVALNSNNYYKPYVCYLDSNKTYQLCSFSSASLSSVFACPSIINNTISTQPVTLSSNLKFVFDTVNNIIPYRLEYPIQNNCSDYQHLNFVKWTNNFTIKKNVGNTLYSNINYKNNFSLNKKQNAAILYLNNSSLYQQFTPLFSNNTTTKWQPISKYDIGITESPTYQTDIKFDKNNNMILAYTKSIDFDSIKIKNITANTLIDFPALNNNNLAGSSYYYQFELDNNNNPLIAYANVCDSENVIIKKYENNVWTRLGNINFKSNWFQNKPQLIIDKNNNYYFQTINGVTNDLNIYQYKNNNWQIITSSISNWYLSSSYYAIQKQKKFAFDTNNILNTILYYGNNINLNNFGISKFDGNNFNTVNESITDYHYNFYDFEIEKSQNEVYVTKNLNSSGYYQLQKFNSKNWVNVGTTFNFNRADANDFNARNLFFDSLGNPFYFGTNQNDTSKLSLFYLKNNVWQKVGNDFVSKFPINVFNGAVNSNKIFVFYSNMGGWLKSIDLPALANMNSFIDSCYGNQATIKVNVSNALSYQWQINTNNDFFQNINNGNGIAGANSSQLQISKNLSDMSIYQYRCVLNRLGNYFDTTNIIIFSCRYLDSIKAIPEMLLFPNPTQKIFTVDAKQPIKFYKLNDILGKAMLSENFNNNNVTRINIDISNVCEGIYFLCLELYNGTKRSFKIIKKY